MDGLLELAVIVEHARAGDPDLDVRVHSLMAATGWKSNGVKLAFTDSVDAAMTLVPAGMGISMAQHGKRGDDCSAYVGDSDSDARGNFMTNTFNAEAKTMALALTAACLKAQYGRKPPQKRRK